MKPHISRLIPRLLHATAITLPLCLVLAVAPPAHAAAPGGKSDKVDRMLQKAIDDSAKQAPPPIEAPPLEAPPESAVVEEPAPLQEDIVEDITTEMPEQDMMVFGNMRFYPSMTLKTGYDDNVEALNTNTKGDFFASIIPQVHAVMVGGRNEFSFDLMYEGRQYLDEDDESTHNYLASLEGVVKGERLEVPYKAFFNSAREERNEDLLREMPNEPIRMTSFGGEAGIRSLPDQPLGFALLGRIMDFQHEDDRTENGTRVVRSDADHETWEAEGEVSYAFMPGHRFSLGALYGENSYKNRNFQGGSFTGATRDSSRYAGWLGWAFSYNGTLNAKARLGYEDRSYDDATIEDIDNILARLDVNWNLGETTSLNFTAARNHYEDDEIIDPILQTKTGITVEQKLMDKVLLEGGASWQLRDFKNSTREDTTIMVDAGVSYYLTDKISVGADYRFETQDSDLAAADYDRNLYMLRVKGEL